MRRAGSFAAWAAALFGVLYALRKKSWKVKGAVIVGFLAVAVVIGALISSAAIVNTYYLDNASVGGTCSDSYTEAQARNSSSHPFCTADAMDSVVPSGAYVKCRGNYGDWKLDAAKASTTTIQPVSDATCKTTGIWLSGANNWAILGGVEVTGTDGSPTPGTDTGRVLVDDSDNVALGRLNVHDTIQGVRIINGSVNVKIEGGKFEDLSCSRYLDSCGTNDEGSGVSADASITGLVVRGAQFIDDEGEAVESGIGATIGRRNRIDWITRESDRTGTWTVADVTGGATFNTEYNAVTNGTTKVWRVGPGDFPTTASGTLLPDPLITATAKTAGTRVVFLAVTEGLDIAPLFPRDGGSYSTFEDFKTRSFYIGRSTGVTMRDVSVSAADTTPLAAGTFTADGSAGNKNKWFAKGATDATVVGGEVGPNTIWDDYDAWLYGCGTGDVGGDGIPPDAGDDCDSGSAPQIDALSGTPLTNLRILGHTFKPIIQNRRCRTAHDGNATFGFATEEACGDGHGDCIHWFNGSGTIDGATFVGCWVDDMLPVKSTDLTVQNSLFLDNTPSDPVGPVVDAGPKSISFSGTCASNPQVNQIWRYNTWRGNGAFSLSSPGPCFTTSEIHDNAIRTTNTAGSLCAKAGLVLTNNKAESEFSGTCGDSAEIAMLGADNLKNSASGYPAKDSPLVNAGTGAAPAYDHDGYDRDDGSPDIGAYERP